MATFEDKLKQGRVGEELVVKWLKMHGYGVIPSYEYSGKDGQKAPKLTFKSKGFAIPDLDICHPGREGLRGGNRIWFEVKTYTRPAFNRRAQMLVHGIKKRHYDHYKSVQKFTNTVVVIGVLETSTRELRVQYLDDLEILSCQCIGCTNGKPCTSSSIRDSVYFSRDAMRLVCIVPESEFSAKEAA